MGKNYMGFQILGDVNVITTHVLEVVGETGYEYFEEKRTLLMKNRTEMRKG